MAFHMPEQFRIANGRLGTTAEVGNQGLFFVPIVIGHKRWRARCIASDGDLWEHVSVSLADRIPPWEVMCHVKSLFWDDEDCVMQLHPPRSRYVNDHPHVLHLWRPVGQTIPQPPLYMV